MQRLQLGVPPAEYLDTSEDILRAIGNLREEGVVAVDTETTGLDIIRDTPLYVSAATPRRRIVFSADHIRCVEPLVQAEDTIVVFHNAKFDMHMLANRGIRTTAEVHDTLVMAGMSDSSRSSLGLKDLAVIVYGANDPDAIRYLDFNDTFGRPSKKKSAGDLLRAAPVSVIADYASCDAWTTVRLYHTLKAQLGKVGTWRGNTLWDIFHDIEVPFTKVLWDCERKGMRVNAGKLEELLERWTKEIQQLEQDFSRLAGKPVNLNSPPQVRQYLLGEKGLVSPKWTTGGASGEMKASTGKEALAVWAKAGVPEAIILQKHRELAQLLKTFVRPLLAIRDNRDRIHTTLNQVGTETGRLSSSGPNLQNIPVRTDLGRLIRECFIAADGRRLVVRDYDQLEMKLAAALAGDEVMIGIINAGKDIHAGNAAIAFDLNYDDIMAAVKAKEEYEKLAEEAKKLGLEPPPPFSKILKELAKARKDAKAIGFGTLYGEGAKKLASQIDCTLDEAKIKRARFFQKFVKVLADIERTHARVEQDLCVQTLMGRVRALPAAALKNHDNPRRSPPAYWKALRQAYNTRIQGSGADAAKLAMIRVHNDKRLRELGADLLLQVHDELIMECDRGTENEVSEIVGTHMRDSLSDIGVGLAVVLTSSGKPCDNWAEGK